MKRALFIGYYPNQADLYNRVFFKNLVEAIADTGVECHVLAPVSVTKYRAKTKMIPKKTVELTSKNNPVCVYHPRYISYSSKRLGPIHTGRWSEYAFQKCAIRYMRKLNLEFDFVYGHFFLSGGFTAVKIGNELNIPSFIAFGECDYENEVKRAFDELKPKYINGLTGVVSVSTRNANILKDLEIFNDIPVLISPNAIDASLFYKRDKLECRKKLGMPENKFIVGFVGSFIERKGDKRLLKAVEGLDDVYLAYAGKGNEPPQGEKVLFCQALSHEDIPVFLNAIDVFCLPTLNEGSCNAIVEAAACKVPIISSNLPFNDDLLNDRNSIRIDPMSVEEIKSAIQKLYSNKEKRKELARNIYQDAKKFTIEQRAKNILEFIESCK